MAGVVPESQLVLLGNRFKFEVTKKKALFDLCVGILVRPRITGLAVAKHNKQKPNLHSVVSCMPDASCEII